MSIKSFKDFVIEGTGAAADELEPAVQKDDETKELKPRAKGEKDFADKHKVQVTKHPVAGDHQFDGSREEVTK